MEVSMSFDPAAIVNQVLNALPYPDSAQQVQLFALRPGPGDDDYCRRGRNLVDNGKKRLEEKRLDSFLNYLKRRRGQKCKTRATRASKNGLVEQLTLFDKIGSRE